jgi:hypothetical protein
MKRGIYSPEATPNVQRSSTRATLSRHPRLRDYPAFEGLIDPRGHRKRNRQIFLPPRREIGEGMGFHGVARPAESFRQKDRARQPVANSRTKVFLRAPPPQTIANEGRDGNSGSTQVTLAAVKAVSVAAASSVARLSTALPKKSLRSSDFGGGEIRVREKRAQNRAIGLPLEAVAPSRSKGTPRRFNIKSSSNPLPGPVSQAIGSFPGAIKLKLATPPILMNATGSKNPAAAASAR